MNLKDDTTPLPKTGLIYSLMFDKFDHLDMRVIEDMKLQLNKRVKTDKREIDIKKMADYYCRTEMVARRMVNYLEHNHYNGMQFIIINGDKEYEALDKIRATKVQARHGSEHT